MSAISLIKNLMATKKETPQQVEEDTGLVGNIPGLDLLRRSVSSLPLASQISTLLDEVERLSNVK